MKRQKKQVPQTQEPEQSHRTSTQLIISLLILFVLLTGTVTIILYGTGYRFGFQQGKPTVSKTGILSANSEPNGAQVLIDNHLTTATDNTLNLTPGEYTVKIVKDGYFPWEKKVRIEEKVVSEVDVRLFPMTLKLEGVSTLGVERPVIDPLGTRIAFTVSSQTFRRNGVYIYEMMANPVLPLQGTLKQLVDDTFDTFSKATLSWSPDSQEIIASIAASPSRNESIYVLNAASFNNSPQDVTAVLGENQAVWKTQTAQKDKARMDSLKKPVRELIRNNFSVISWSPDDTKILYTATTSQTLPIMIKPRLLGATNALIENRTIEKGGVYIYNAKEDVNVKLFGSLPTTECEQSEEPCHFPLTWFPDSEHLIFVNEKKVEIMDYDGSNKTTVYAGPFVDHYVFPWPDGSKIVIVTNLNNTSTSPNLYTITLK